MKYDDLLGVPYRHGGRGKDGMDCYGLVLECCRRAGTPLKDFFKGFETLPAEDANDYICRGLNVRRIDAPRKGCIVETVYGGNAHVGYLAERNIVLHATTDKGVRTTALGALKILAYYEVTNENDAVQDAIE